MGNYWKNFGKNFFPPVNGGFLVVVLLTFILGWQLGHRDYNVSWKGFESKIQVSSKQPPKDINVDFKLFWDTWDLVSQKYIDKTAIDPEKMFYGAIKGMVAEIGDPYTVFLPPEAQKSAREELGGSFEGVGIQLGYNKEKRLVVIAPLKDTPAARAGVKSGDMILKIDNKDTTNLTLPEAVNLIRGPKSTSVTLTIFRQDGADPDIIGADSKPQELSITRDTIVVKSVEFESKLTPSGKKIAYIRLSRFGEKTRSEWDEAVSSVLAAKHDAVLVDVRNNPGGFLEGAVYIASEFLNGGAVVLQENAQGERQTFSTVRQGRILELPLFVLINKGSASASEILAGAIGDRERGKLLGETSFGKGTIQSAEELPQNTGIHITTAKWLTPGGKWVHNSGIEPHVKIVSTNGVDGDKDTQLEKALEAIDRM